MHHHDRVGRGRAPEALQAGLEPLRRLAAGAQAVSEGNLDVPITVTTRDEIGELSLPLQAKLLRVIQERQFFPLGSESPMEVDVRLIVATNKDLDAEVETQARTRSGRNASTGRGRRQEESPPAAPLFSPTPSRRSSARRIASSAGNDFCVAMPNSMPREAWERELRIAPRCTLSRSNAPTPPGMPP